MYNKELTICIDDLCIEASNQNKSPSYVTAIVYDKDKVDTKSFIKCDITYEEMFNIWFNEDKKIINELIKNIKNKVGNSKSIYELPNRLLKKYEKESPYYMLEELYVVEYDNYYIYFMAGNNE